LQEQANELPSNKSLLAEFFRHQYTKYVNKIPTPGEELPIIIAATTEATSDTTVTTGTSSQQPQEHLVRSVTPTDDIADDVDEVDAECPMTSILKEIFVDIIINPTVLQQNDLFLVDSSTDALVILTKRIKEIGCRLHQDEVKQHYNRFYKHDDDTCRSIESLETSQHLVLTQRFNIPLSLPALKDILRSIVSISSTIPEVLELDNHGGSKKVATSQRLIAVVPSRNEERLYQNARRWIPKIIATSMEEDTSELSHTTLWPRLSEYFHRSMNKPWKM
jgi:hypothetical protein